MLEKNLEAIEDQMIPEYLDKIRKAERDDWLELIKSKDGHDNLLIHDGSRRIPAYNLEDTLKEVKQQAESLAISTQRTITILIGMGLGYATNELVSQLKEKAKKRDHEHRIVIVEPSLWLIKQAFERFDFSELLQKKMVIIVSDLQDLAIIITALDHGLVVENWVMSIEPYVHNRMATYKSYIEFTANLINQVRCNTGTVASSGSIIADNDIANLPYVIRHRGINELKGLFQGKPAVLVSTGPSLKKNVHLLKDWQDKVIIVAVAQALRILLAYDIRPDFITTVDFGEVNMVHLRGLMDSDVPMICLNKTYAPLLHSYQGPRFITASPNPGYEDKSHGILNNKGALEAGGSVAHLSFSAAVLMGCGPIILIGQDLALTGGESHFAQADAGGKVEVVDGRMLMWKVRDKRCHLSNVEEGRFSMGSEFYVDGYFGEPVLTNVGLASFITSFEGMFKRHKDNHTIINATQGGARINGSIQMSLNQALTKYASKSFDKTTPLIPFLSLANDGDELIQKVIPLLEEDIRLLKQISFHAKRAIRLADKMLSCKRWDKLNKLFTANNYHSTQAENLSKKLPLVALAIYGASRAIASTDYKVKLKADVEHLKRDREDLGVRVRRNKHILSAARNAAISLRKTYAKTLSILQEYQKTKNDKLLSPYIPDEKLDLSDAEDYFQEGNFARPMLIARKVIGKGPMVITGADEYYVRAWQVQQKALEMRATAIEEAEKINEDKLIEANELVQEAWRVGRQEKDFAKALTILEKAKGLDPKNEIVLWGLATTYHHIGELAKSIAGYKELVKIKPDDPKYVFEMGQVHIKAGDIQEGLEHIQKAMEQSEEFDSFLWVVGDICREGGLKEKALLAYNTYLEKFQADYKVMEKKAHLLKELGHEEEVQALLHQAKEIQGK